MPNDEKGASKVKQLRRIKAMITKCPLILEFESGVRGDRCTFKDILESFNVNIHGFQRRRNNVEILGHLDWQHDRMITKISWQNHWRWFLCRRF
jgi:hypothetical protein